MKQPKVTIVIVAYLEENKHYLELALRSIQNLDYQNKEVILLSSGDYEPKFSEGLIKIHSHSKTRRHYPESINKGIELASDDSEYYFILNDDVILTKDSLKNLVLVSQGTDGIFQPISNCDNQFRYSLQLGTINNEQFIPFPKRFYRYEEFPKEVWQSVQNSYSIYPPGLIIQDFVAFYATLIPKTTWQKVGTLDPNFKTGQDDLDYCKRARQLNIGSYVCLSSFVFHFGGVTADLALDWDTRMYNMNYYKQKWNEQAKT